MAAVTAALSAGALVDQRVATTAATKAATLASMSVGELVDLSVGPRAASKVD